MDTRKQRINGAPSVIRLIERIKKDSVVDVLRMTLAFYVSSYVIKLMNMARGLLLQNSSVNSESMFCCS